MKTTTALSTRMRQLLVNLHPPSPPTAQEGQQLLNILQSSFKRQLDARHPNPHSANTVARHDQNIPILRESTSAHATASYMSSILAHPIIGSLDGLHTKADAVAKFERLVAESTIAVPRLAALMQWYNRATKTEGNAPRDDSFGEKLNAWLLSTNEPMKTEFFLNDNALKAAIHMLSDEDNESVLWTWLRAVYERDSLATTLTSPKWLHVEDLLVSSLMRMAISRAHYDEAAQQFNQACQYKVASGRQSSQTDVQVTPLPLSGKRLASSIIFHRHTHFISAESFNVALSYLPSWSVSPETSSAFCELYSPSTASAQKLAQHLHQEPELLVKRQNKASRTSRKVIMTALLDAAKLSLDQGKKGQASWLLNFAIDNYPDYLPPRQIEEIEPQLELSLNLVPVHG